MVHRVAVVAAKDRNDDDPMAKNARGARESHKARQAIIIYSLEDKALASRHTNFQSTCFAPWRGRRPTTLHFFIFANHQIFNLPNYSSLDQQLRTYNYNMWNTTASIVVLSNHLTTRCRSNRSERNHTAEECSVQLKYHSTVLRVVTE